jgi:hypothetical protein
MSILPATCGICFIDYGGKQTETKTSWIELQTCLYDSRFNRSVMNNLFRGYMLAFNFTDS